MNKKEFNELVKNQLVNYGYDVNLEENRLIATNKRHEVKIDLNAFYVKTMCESSKDCLDETVAFELEKHLEIGDGIIDFENVFPVLKKKDFSEAYNTEYMKDNFSFDLDILYVEVKDESLRFLEGNKESELIRSKAMKNLESRFVKPILENEELCIYRYPFSYYLNNAMLLLDQTKEFLKSKYGKYVLMMVTSEAFVVFCKNDELGYFYLQQFVKELLDDPDTISISEKIYLWDLESNYISAKMPTEMLKIIRN